MNDCNPCGSALLITSVACSIFNCLPREEIELLATQFTQLGDTLATMLVYQSTCCPDEDPCTNNIEFTGISDTDIDTL